ncbi:hypothetical protein CHUAL_008542 [Chamberlinius hualienensis]
MIDTMWKKVSDLNLDTIMGPSATVIIKTIVGLAANSSLNGKSIVKIVNGLGFSLYLGASSLTASFGPEATEAVQNLAQYLQSPLCLQGLIDIAYPNTNTIIHYMWAPIMTVVNNMISEFNSEEE